MEVVNNEDLLKAWSKKMAPPLVTLLSSEPEVRRRARPSSHGTGRQLPWPECTTPGTSAASYSISCCHRLPRLCCLMP
jgi:hypothetical protein